MTSALQDLVRVQIEPSAVEVPPSFSTNPTAHFINFLHYLLGLPVGMPRKIPRE